MIMQQIEENEQLINMPMIEGGEAPPKIQPALKVGGMQPPPIPSAPNEVVISTALDPEMKIKKNYQRGQEEAANAKPVGTQKCPKCS